MHTIITDVGKGNVESLQSHCIHTMSHWSSGLPVCFPLWETWVQSRGGYLCEAGILLLACLATLVTLTWLIIVALSEAGFVRNVTRPSCWQCDNPTWSHTAFLSQFHARCRPSFRLHNHIVGCWGEGLWRACNLTPFTPCLTGPVDYLFASGHEGPEFNPQRGTYVKTGFSC